MTHVEVNGIQVGQHPLVTCFLKGVFNSRPPAPKYTLTWDVNVALRYLRELTGNHALTLQQLAHKLAMLLALAKAVDAQSLTDILR